MTNLCEKVNNMAGEDLSTQWMGFNKHSIDLVWK